MSDTFFLHVGTRKSGTTTIQRIVTDSQSALAEQGVDLPLGAPVNSTRRAFVHDLSTLSSPTDPQAEAFASGLRAQIREAEQPLGFFSAEGLAPKPATVTEALLDRLADIDTHVIITARDLGRQVPSEWQQSAKVGTVPRYDEFCQQVRNTDSEWGAWFDARYNVSDIASRWGAALPPERVHIQVLPHHADNLWLPRSFFGLMGVETASLEIQQPRLNRTMTYPEAEIRRRVVAKTMETTGARKREIARTVARLGAPLEEERSGRLPVLPEILDWCQEAADRQIDEIRQAGWHVIGDLDDLRPAESRGHFDLAAQQTRELTVAVDYAAGLLARELMDRRGGLAAATASFYRQISRRIRTRARDLRSRVRR